MGKAGLSRKKPGILLFENKLYWEAEIGWHKKIIELNHPDSVYFEKAVFYLKPGITHFPAQMAESEAKRFLLRTGQPECSAAGRWRKIGTLAAVGLVSSCLTMILCYVLIR